MRSTRARFASGCDRCYVPCALPSLVSFYITERARSAYLMWSRVSGRHRNSRSSASAWCGEEGNLREAPTHLIENGNTSFTLH